MALNKMAHLIDTYGGDLRRESAEGVYGAEWRGGVAGRSGGDGVAHTDPVGLRAKVAISLFNARHN